MVEGGREGGRVKGWGGREGGRVGGGWDGVVGREGGLVVEGGNEGG